MGSCALAGDISTRCTLHEATDDLLVAAAQSGEHLAFVELWNRHSKATYRAMCRITRSPEDGEDALQDAFMKAFVHLKGFDGRSKFSTWLMRIAINSALVILRKRRAHPETSIDSSIDNESWQHWEMVDQTIDIEAHYARCERTEHLKRAIRRLPSTLRTIVEIQQLHDSSVKEAAAIAGISVPATKSRLLRARTALRRSLYEPRRGALRGAVSSGPGRKESDAQ
jgi:RNA polymerase sigma factor (sigma-70 family)